MRKIMGLFIGLLMILTSFASIVSISTIGAEVSGVSNETTTQKASGLPKMFIDKAGPVRGGEGDFKIMNAEGNVNSTRPVYIRSVQVLKYDVKEANNHTISFEAVEQEIQQTTSTDVSTTQSSTISLTSSTRTRVNETFQTTTTSQGMGTTVVIPPSEKPLEPKIDKFIFVSPPNWTIDSTTLNFAFGKLNTEKTVLTIDDPKNISTNTTPSFKLVKTNVVVAFNEEDYYGDNVIIYKMKDINVLKIIIKGELMNFMPGRFQSVIEFRKIVDERFGNKNGLVETVEVENFIKKEASQIEQHTSEYNNGYNDGYKTGYDEGYKAGYKDGYNDGKMNKEKDYTPDYNPEEKYEEKESLIMMDGVFPEMIAATVDVVGAEGSISSNTAITMDILLSGKISIDTTVDKHTVTLMKEFYSPEWDGPAFANVVYTAPDGWKVSPDTLPENITATNDGTTVSFSTNMLKGPCKFVIVYNESAKAPIITKAAGTLYFTMTKINEFNMSISGLDAIKILGGELKTYSDLRNIIDRKGTTTMPGFGNGDGTVNDVEVKNFENFVATDIVKGDKAPPKSGEGIPMLIDGKVPEITTQKTSTSGILNTATTNNDPIKIVVKMTGRYYTESVDEHKVVLYIFRPEVQNEIQKNVTFKAVVIAMPNGWVIDPASKPSVGTLSYSNTVYTIYTNETKEDISFRAIVNKSSVTPILTLEDNIIYIVGYPNNTLEIMIRIDMLTMIKQNASDPNTANITSYSDIRKIIDHPQVFGNNDGTITADEVAKLEAQWFKGQPQPTQQPGQTPSGEPQSPTINSRFPIEIDGMMPMVTGAEVEFQNISGSVDSNTLFTANIKLKATFRVPDKDRYVVGVFDPTLKNGTSAFSGITVVTAPGWIIDNTTVPSELGTVSLDKRVLEVAKKVEGVKFTIMRSADNSVKNITPVQGKLYFIMSSEGTNDTRVVYLKADGIDVLTLPVPKTYLDARRDIDICGNKNGMITYEELKNYGAEIARRISMGEQQPGEPGTTPEEMPGMKMLVDGSLPMRAEFKLKLIGAVGNVASNDTITADSIVLYEFPQRFVPIQTIFAENWSVNISTGPVNFVWSGVMASLPPQMTEFKFDGHALEIVWKDMPYMPYMVPPNGTNTNTSVYMPAQFQNISGYRIYMYELYGNVNVGTYSNMTDTMSNRVLIAVFNVSNTTHNFVLKEPFKKTKIIFRVVALNDSGNEGPYGNDVFFDFMMGAGMMPNPKIQFADNTPPTSENLTFDTFVLIVPNGWSIDNASIKPEIRPYVFDYKYIKVSKADILAHSLSAASLDMMLIRNETSISPKLENLSITGSVYAVIMHTPYNIEQIQKGIDVRKEMHVDSYSEIRKLIDSVEWAGNGDGYLSEEEVHIFEKMVIDREKMESNEGVKDYEVGRKDGYGRGFEQGYYAGYVVGYNDGKGNKSYEASYGSGYNVDSKVSRVPKEETKEIVTLKEELTVIPSENFDYIMIVQKKVLDAAGVRALVMEVDKAGNRNDVVEQEEITNFTEKMKNVTTNMSKMPPITIDDSMPVKKQTDVDVSALLGLIINTTKSITIVYTDNLTFVGIQAGEIHTIKGNVGEKPISADTYIKSPLGWVIENVTSNLTNAIAVENKTTAKATITEKDVNRTMSFVFNKLVPKFEVAYSALPVEIRLGDSFDISVKIRNNGTANGSITLSALGSISNWVAFEGKSSTEIPLEPGKEISVTCKISVPSNASTGGYTVTIAVGSEQKTLNLTITAKPEKKAGFIPGFEIAGFVAVLGLVGLLVRRRRK
jgi:flagellar biosynthesis/type III secretory pathway protein FliH